MADDTFDASASMLKTARNLQQLCLERGVSVDHTLRLLEAAEEGNFYLFIAALRSMLSALAEARKRPKAA